MASLFDVPVWDNTEALNIGIAEDVQSPRTETIKQFELDTTINFLCPWNRRFAAADYIWGHTAPIVGSRSRLFNGPNQTLPVNLFRHTVPLTASPNNVVDMSTIFWKPVATQVQISAFPEPGSPANVGRTPYDSFDVGNWTPNNPDNLSEFSYVHHTLAKLAVSYVAFAKCADWTTSVSMTPQIESRKLPPYGYFWDHDRSPVEEDQAPFILEDSMLIDLTFSNTSYLPRWLWIYNGTVNKSSRLLKMGVKHTQYFEPGTLLLIVKSIANKRTARRAVLDDMWDVTLSFHYVRLGFNRFRRMSSLIGTAADLYFDKIVDVKGDEVKNYEEVDWVSDFSTSDGAFLDDFYRGTTS